MWNTRVSLVKDVGSRSGNGDDDDGDDDDSSSGCCEHLICVNLV